MPPRLKKNQNELRRPDDMMWDKSVYIPDKAIILIKFAL